MTLWPTQKRLPLAVWILQGYYKRVSTENITLCLSKMFVQFVLCSETVIINLITHCGDIHKCFFQTAAVSLGDRDYVLHWYAFCKEMETAFSRSCLIQCFSWKKEKEPHQFSDLSILHVKIT